MDSDNVKFNYIKGNYISSNQSYGIYITDCDKNTIISNKIYHLRCIQFRVVGVLFAVKRYQVHE